MNIRSKTAIRSTPIRHFADTSIACRALNIMPKDLMMDLNTMGLLLRFWKAVYQDLLCDKSYPLLSGSDIQNGSIGSGENGWIADDLKSKGYDDTPYNNR